MYSIQSYWQITVPSGRKDYPHASVVQRDDRVEVVFGEQAAPFIFWAGERHEFPYTEDDKSPLLYVDGVWDIEEIQALIEAINETPEPDERVPLFVVKAE